MKVVIAEPNNRYSFDASETYGDLVFLSNVSLNPFDSANIIGIFSRRLDEIEFDPEEDFICLTGKTITVAILFAVVAVKYNKFKTLMFDARVSAYRERTILIKENSNGKREEKQV